MIQAQELVKQKTEKIATKLARILKRRTPKIKVEFKPLKATIAQAYCDKFIIQYSVYHFFLLTQRNQDKVIAHEVCHIFFPKEVHGPNWATALNKLGYKANIYVDDKEVQKKFLPLHQFILKSTKR